MKHHLLTQWYFAPAMLLAGLLLAVVSLHFQAWILDLLSLSLLISSLYLFLKPSFAERAALKSLGLTIQTLAEFNDSFAKISRRVFNARAMIVFNRHPAILEWTITSIIDGKECLFIYSSSQIKDFIDSPVAGLKDFFEHYGVKGNYFELARSPIRDMEEGCIKNSVYWFYLDSDKQKPTPAADHCARCKRPFNETRNFERFISIVLHESKPWFRVKQVDENVDPLRFAYIGERCLKEVKMDWGVIDTEYETSNDQK